MIIYFIFSGKYNSKVGGHYQSVKTIARAISNKKKTLVIVLGYKFVDIYSSDGIDVEFFKLNPLNFLPVFIKLLNKIKLFKPEALHAFDSFSYLMVRLLSFASNTPAFLTKCGGPNFNHLAMCQNTIYFSKENFEYAAKSKKYKKTNRYLIPNRTLPPELNVTRINHLKGYFDDFDGIKFLRINRIGVYYQKTMMDSIRMVDFLNSTGISARLYIIGFATEIKLLNELSGENVVFLTEEKFYLNASELIPLFDIVIGTGRSAMEALAYGKILMSPIENLNYPIVVTTENFSKFLEFNFSERVILDDYDDDKVEFFLKNTEFSVLIRQTYPAQLFDVSLNVLNVIDEYLRIYQVRNPRQLYILDFFIQSSLFCAKHFFDLFRDMFPFLKIWLAKLSVRVIGGSK